jgi:hypothetical protein
MLIEAFQTVDWQVLWKITSYRDGCAFDVEDTGTHIRRGQTPPEGYEVSSISTRLTRTGQMVEINEYTP